MTYSRSCVNQVLDKSSSAKFVFSEKVEIHANVVCHQFKVGDANVFFLSENHFKNEYKYFARGNTKNTFDKLCASNFRMAIIHLENTFDKMVKVAG